MFNLYLAIQPRPYITLRSTTSCRTSTQSTFTLFSSIKILIVGFYDTDVPVMIRWILQSVLQKCDRQDISVESVGSAQTCSGRPVDTQVIQVLSKRGVAESTTLEQYRARYFGEVKAEEFDFIITTMEPIKTWVISRTPGAKVYDAYDKDVAFIPPSDRLPAEVIQKKYGNIADAVERVLPQILQFIGVKP